MAKDVLLLVEVLLLLKEIIGSLFCNNDRMASRQSSPYRRPIGGNWRRCTVAGERLFFGADNPPGGSHWPPGKFFNFYGIFEVAAIREVFQIALNRARAA